MIRLLMADDHPIVRAGLRAVLETEPDFVIIAEATTAEQAIELSAELEVDVVLMDLQFGPGMHGVDAIARIAALPSAVCPGIDDLRHRCRHSRCHRSRRGGLPPQRRTAR